MTNIKDLFIKFALIVPDLMKMGFKDGRLATSDDYINKDYITEDYFAFMERWLDNWIEMYHKPWLKIRKENPEDIWNRYELMEYGDDFQEIRVMNELAKNAIKAFNVKNNHFLKCNIPKKPKKQRMEEE